MARDDDDDLELDAESPAKGKGNLWKIMFFVMIGVLILGISIGLTWFLVSGSGDNSAGDGGSEVAAEVKDKPKQVKQEEVEAEDPVGKQVIYIEVKPSIVVNPNDPETEFTYLRVGVSIMVTSEKDKELVELHMPSIRQNLVLLFGDQHFSELMTSDGKRALQKQALEVTQEAMKAAVNKSVIKDLYITDLVGQ